MKILLGTTVITAALMTLGCGNKADPPKAAPSPAQDAKMGEGRTMTGVMKGIGKKTPDAVFDAVIGAAKKPDEKEYLGLVANHELADQHEMLVKQFSGSLGREEGVMQVMSLVLSGMAVDEPHKRFPAEINGDTAQIILLRADKFDKKKTQYLKYEFTKSGDDWYYMANSFGPAEDIDQTKYSWERGE